MSRIANRKNAIKPFNVPFVRVYHCAWALPSKETNTLAQEENKNKSKQILATEWGKIYSHATTLTMRRKRFSELCKCLENEKPINHFASAWFGYSFLFISRRQNLQLIYHRKLKTQWHSGMKVKVFRFDKQINGNLYVIIIVVGGGGGNSGRGVENAFTGNKCGMLYCYCFLFWLVVKYGVFCSHAVVTTTNPMLLWGDHANAVIIVHCKAIWVPSTWHKLLVTQCLLR